MQRGTVKWFNFRTGIGYITPVDGSDDVMVRASAVTNEGRLEEGQQVEFEAEDSAFGLAAQSVRFVG